MTSTPSSPNWGSGKSSSSRTTLGPTGHRLGTGPPRARGRAGVVEHVLLRNADAPAAGGDLALLHTRDQKRREACVAVFGNWLFRRMYWWQVGSFIRDAYLRREFVPLLYQQFDATPSARPAFFRLNGGSLPMVRSRTQMIPKLKKFRRPVRIIFGDADRSLNGGVARTPHEFLPGSELFLIPGAQHFVQLDEPEQVARLILAMPGPGEHAGLMRVTKSATEPMARWGTAYGRWGTAAMAREQIRVCDRKRLFGNRW